MRIGTHAGALAIVGCSLAGCTTGNRWVEAPENGSACAAEFCNDAKYDTEVALIHYETAKPSVHKRLDHVIKLGSVVDTRNPAAAQAEYRAPGPGEYSLYDNYTDYAGWYGGWGGGWGWGGGLGRGRRARGVRDFGPPFPFSTAPASPWAPAAGAGRFNVNRFGTGVPDFGPAFPFRTAPASPWAPAGPTMRSGGSGSRRR